MWLSLVILAAWFGSRYGGLKQIDWFGPQQEPIILYSVYDALQAWFDHVVFVIREDFADLFVQHIGRYVEKVVRVSYVFQTKDAYVPIQYKNLISWREKPWGTAHATLVAKDVVSQPFAVINADDFYGRDAFLQIAWFLSTCTPEQIGMVGYVLKNTVSPFGSINRWVCEVKNNSLVSIIERLKIVMDEAWQFSNPECSHIDPLTPVSMNFWWFHQSFFWYIETHFEEFLETWHGAWEYFIPLVVDRCLHDEHMNCKVMMSNDLWCGVSYQEDKPFVQESIAELHAKWVYPEQLFS